MTTKNNAGIKHSREAKGYNAQRVRKVYARAPCILGSGYNRYRACAHTWHRSAVSRSCVRCPPKQLSTTPCRLIHHSQRDLVREHSKAKLVAKCAGSCSQHTISFPQTAALHRRSTEQARHHVGQNCCFADWNNRAVLIHRNTVLDSLGVLIYHPLCTEALCG